MRGNATLAESQIEAFIQWVGSVQMSESANVSSAPDGIAGALPSSPTCPVVGPDGKAIAAASQAAPGAGAQPGTAACPVVGAKGKMPAASGATEPVVAAPAAALEKPQIKMEAPVGWKTVPPSTMRYASFAVTNDGGESADISVSTFGGEGGGDLENVNRWRQQIGLEAIGAGELKGMIVPVPCKDGEILTVDMTGREARILAGWARVDGKSWFFKLAGAKQLSEAQKGNFVKFLQSVQFHP